jgi:glucose/arabinose dehydrogenase
MKNTLLLIISLTSFVSFSQAVGIELFKAGFTNPVEIVHAPGDARLFVVQQGGAIRILNPDKTINATNFLTLTTATISTGGERGLLGLAFHPNYATNGYFFVDYTNTAGNTVIARYSVSANPNIANTTGTILMTITQPFSNHNGGTLRFGPDGYLYIGMGDGGSGGDPANRAQNITENLGKMLRIDVDGTTTPTPNYGIPPGNPYVGIAGNDEIWAIGLRNPWKWSFNRLNGDLWIADVGQGGPEEINKVSGAAAGLNYGWKCYEGNNVYTSGCSVPTTTYTFPVATYLRPNDGSGLCSSITGGYVYTGSAYPNFLGKYFFADYCSGKIGFTTEAGVITWSASFGTYTFTTFGEDVSGELYVANAANGTIYKLIDTTLGVNSFVSKSLQLYPNPASSEVFIKANGMTFPASVNIFDITGKLLLSHSLHADTNAITTSALQSGVYMVNIKDHSGADFNSKLTIQ